MMKKEQNGVNITRIDDDENGINTCHIQVIKANVGEEGRE